MLRPADGPPFLVYVLLLGSLSTMLWRVREVRLFLTGKWGSDKWPWTQTRIEQGFVELIQRGRGGDVYRLTVQYTYQVGGQRFGGEYCEHFESGVAAEAVLKSMQELPPPTRYKQSKPSVSVLDPYRDVALGLTTPQSPSSGVSKGA